MKAIIEEQYEYSYYWVKYRGRIVVAELRKKKPGQIRNHYHIPGEIMIQFEDDIEVLRMIEDYK